MSKEQAIFKGNKARRIWRFSEGYRGFSKREKGETVRATELIEKNVTFYTCELEKPPLEIGDKIYINELDETYTIVSKARSIDGETVYYVQEWLEVIEDEETERSLKFAEQQKLEELIEIKKEIEKNKKARKKWYQFWKE